MSCKPAILFKMCRGSPLPTSRILASLSGLTGPERNRGNALKKVSFTCILCTFMVYFCMPQISFHCGYLIIYYLIILIFAYSNHSEFHQVRLLSYRYILIINGKVFFLYKFHTVFLSYRDFLFIFYFYVADKKKNNIN